MMRADCFQQQNQLEMAASDYLYIYAHYSYRRAAKLRPDNIHALLRLSNLRLDLGEPREAISSLKDCLKFDIEHKECKRLFKATKKFLKEYDKLEGMFKGESFATVIKVVATRPDTNLINQAKALGIGGNILTRMYEFVCGAYAALSDGENAKKWCEDTLKIDENNVEALIVLANAMIDREEYEDALRTFKKAFDNGEDRRVFLSISVIMCRLVRDTIVLRGY